MPYLVQPGALNSTIITKLAGLYACRIDLFISPLDALLSLAASSLFAEIHLSVGTSVLFHQVAHEVPLYAKLSIALSLLRRCAKIDKPMIMIIIIIIIIIVTTRLLLPTWLLLDLLLEYRPH